MTNTCTHLYDNGHHCGAVAVEDQRFCVYHLRHRARQHRMAQYRARGQRFDLQLPPLEDMPAVHSALNQLVEAVAAGMLDLKRANFLLSAVRSTGKFLMARDKWPASVAQSDQPTAVDVAAEFGLPNDIDLATSPAAVQPQPTLSDMSSRAEGEGSAFPTSAGDLDVRPDSPVTPEMVEIVEVSRTRGPDAAALRAHQLERNRQRRQLRNDRQHYAQVALQHNLQRAAETLAQQKLAAERTVQPPDPAPAASKKPVAFAEYEAQFGDAATKSTA